MAVKAFDLGPGARSEILNSHAKSHPIPMAMAMAPVPELART